MVRPGGCVVLCSPRDLKVMGSIQAHGRQLLVRGSGPVNPTRIHGL